MEVPKTTNGPRHAYRNIFYAFLFFLPFFLLLPIRDGKQELVDIVGAATVTTASVIVFIYGKIRRQPHPHITRLWIVALVYFILRTVFSDDIGYSLYDTIRLLNAWVIFYLCYCYSNRDTVKYFSNGSVFRSFSYCNPMKRPCRPAVQSRSA